MSVLLHAWLYALWAHAIIKFSVFMVINNIPLASSYALESAGLAFLISRYVINKDTK